MDDHHPFDPSEYEERTPTSLYLPGERRCGFGDREWWLGAAVMIVAVVAAAAVVLIVALRLLGWL